MQILQDEGNGGEVDRAEDREPLQEHLKDVPCIVVPLGKFLVNARHRGRVFHRAIGGPSPTDQANGSVAVPIRATPVSRQPWRLPAAIQPAPDRPSPLAPPGRQRPASRSRSRAEPPALP